MAVENVQLAGAKISAVTALFLHRPAPRRGLTPWAKARHAGSNLLAAATIATIMVISGAVIGAIFVLWPVPAAAETVDAIGAETASDLVRTVIDQGTAAIIAARELNSDTHAGVVFSDIFVEKFATDRIGRVLLGDHWATATPREQGEFITAFGVYLADRIVKKFPSGKFKFLDQQEDLSASADRPVLLVKTVFITLTSSTMINWKVDMSEAEPRILDIVIRDQSLMEGKHDEFKVILARNDGSVSALIADF